MIITAKTFPRNPSQRYSFQYPQIKRDGNRAGGQHGKSLSAVDVEQGHGRFGNQQHAYAEKQITDIELECQLFDFSQGVGFNLLIGPFQFQLIGRVQRQHGFAA